jgi:hypothetical protein
MKPNVTPLNVFFILFFLLTSCGQQSVGIDCGADDNLSIDQRIYECNETKFLTNDQELTLVSRQFIYSNFTSQKNHQFGEVKEFHKDPKTGLIWQTSLNNLATSREEAQKICKELKALNLNWRLPSPTEFLLFGNLTNRSFTFDKERKANPHIKEIFELTFDNKSKKVSDYNFWTNSFKYSVDENSASKNLMNKKAIVFNVETSKAEDSIDQSKRLVQCVSKDSLKEPTKDKNI